MTPDDRLNILRALDALLRDNLGNRLTHALVVGIVNTLHDHIPVQVEQPQPQKE